MNLMPKIAEMLGVEIGEEFKLKQTTGDIKSAKYRFRNIGDQIIYEHTDFCGDWTMCSAEDVGLLVLGKHEVVKLPFEPKDGEKYWTVFWKGIGNMPCAVYETWYGDSCDFANKVGGNCFRTEAEAEKHKYEIYEKLTGGKWGEKCDS